MAGAKTRDNVTSAVLRNWRMGVPFQRTPQGSGPSQFFPDRLGSYGDFACGYRLLPGPRPCSSGSTTIRSAASAEAGPPARILHNPPSATASVARNCRPECRRRPCCQRPCGHPGGSRRQSLPGLRRPALRSPVRVLASQDPMSEKYYGISPYAYCAGDPVNLVDIDGCKLYFAKDASPEFKKRFAEAVRIMNSNGISYNIAKLEQSESIYYIAETTNFSFTETSITDKKTATVFWNPNIITINENGIHSSPVTALAHEMSHAAGYDASPAKYDERLHQIDDAYDNKEEKRVIEGDEQVAARKLGEITPNMVTRKDHKALETLYPISFSTPLEDIITLTIRLNFGTNDYYKE